MATINSQGSIEEFVQAGLANAGPLGAVDRNRQSDQVYLSGPHKGKTLAQVAQMLEEEAASQGLRPAGDTPPNSQPARAVLPGRTSGTPLYKSQPLTKDGGLDGLAAMNPGMRMGAPPALAGSVFGFQPPGAAPTPLAAPAASSMPGLGQVATAASQVISNLNQNRDAAFAKQQTQHAADVRTLTQGAADQRVGITQRGANSVQYNNGDTITGPAGGARTLTSAYGTGSSSQVAPGQVASDPALRTEIAAIKARHAQGIYGDPSAGVAFTPPTANVKATMASVANPAAAAPSTVNSNARPASGPPTGSVPAAVLPPTTKPNSTFTFNPASKQTLGQQLTLHQGPPTESAQRVAGFIPTPPTLPPNVAKTMDRVIPGGGPPSPPQVAGLFKGHANAQATAQRAKNNAIADHFAPPPANLKATMAAFAPPGPSTGLPPIPMAVLPNRPTNQPKRSPPPSLTLR